MSAEGVAEQGGGAVEAALAFAESQPETPAAATLVWQDPVPTAAAGATMTGMEYMEAIVAGEMPPPPIAVTMRMRPIELGEGRAVFEGEPGEEHYNPIGVVHGGYAATLLDSALGCAVHTTLPAGVGYTSLGLEVEVRAPDHPRHRPRPLRGQRPLPRSPPGDGRGQPHRGGERQAARPRHRHLHDPRWLKRGARRTRARPVSRRTP